MIEYTLEEFTEIQKYFPNLYYDEKENCIRGELNFSARYQKQSKKKGEDIWEIIPCSSGSDCLRDCYEIKILLNDTQSEWPKVFETGGRIEKLAAEIGKPIIDLHIYPSNNSCCLGIDFNTNITLRKFVLNKVYPYFVWQAYFDKYRKIPPCGEYSHGGKGFAEYRQDLEKIGRNDPCICGSGEKYKKCCAVLYK